MSTLSLTFKLRCFQIIGSLVDVFGAMEFTNNEASNAAAMELLSFAQVRLHNGAKVEFRENMGRYVYKK